ncbi:glycosyltransferase family 2 protein [Paraburkholderia sp. RP-4-7]|uniref:Glycosyltransferase family 2 protein n=1 Tax=Paraburkholderia polaris TaxID=2728848 RepID=A0A848I5D3_9BURK|nr:glycosyltransferase family A protein [Paraburkholderia polaris]NML96699.1 glycosyltransferase family 2 protein [Paraburkholderia polaris]
MNKIGENVPVVVFAYNRPRHLDATLGALRRAHGANEIDVLIFCDGPRNESEQKAVNEVRDIARNSKGFRSVKVFTSDENRGLGDSVVRGVSHALSFYESVIVIEDDVEVSPGFLIYMCGALSEYINNNKVFSISGYSPPVEGKEDFNDGFFIPRICSWGWATWRDRWQSVDWNVGEYELFIKDRSRRSEFCRAGRDMLDMLINQVEGESESWAIRFDFARFISGNKLTLYPSSSLVKNSGMDGSGEHFEKSQRYQTQISQRTEFAFPSCVNEASELTVAFSEFYPRRLRSRLAILARRMRVHGPARKAFRFVFR